MNLPGSNLPRELEVEYHEAVPPSPPSSLLDQWGVTVQSLHSIVGRTEEPSYKQDQLCSRLCLKCETGVVPPISSLPRRARSVRRRRGGVHYNNWRIAAPVAKFCGAEQSERWVSSIRPRGRGRERSRRRRAGRHGHWQADRELPRFAFKFFEGPRLT